MHLRDHELRGLRVETTAGEYIGRLIGFVFDTDGCVVSQFRVRPPGILPLFDASRELLIHVSQVVSVDEQRMVVRSGGARADDGERRTHAAPSPQPIASSVTATITTES